MREYCWNAIQNNSEYLSFLSLIGGLSNLFAESDIPFIHYRVTENLFCKCFGAENLARYDSAYDAKNWDAGIGIKTFILPRNGTTLQKVAEFDSLSGQLAGCSIEDAARTVAEWRNQRIEASEVLHAIKAHSVYHIIGRMRGMLKLFVADYDRIRIDAIRNIKQTKGGFTFTDGLHRYTFNRAKSTLLEQFTLPPEKEVITVPVQIHQDPFEMLKRLLDNPFGQGVIRVQKRDGAERLKLDRTDERETEQRSVVLPLFSTRENGEVSLKSGLNQWNAAGRRRHPDEVYIPVPKRVHKEDPTFFPEKEEPFTLKLPNGNSLSAKMCQEGRKGLMSNPNKALGRWLLRDVLQIPEGQLVTREMLDIRGFDSVIIIKESNLVYRLELSREAHYRDYCLEDDED